MTDAGADNGVDLNGGCKFLNEIKKKILKRKFNKNIIKKYISLC